MIPVNPLEHQNAFKMLYGRCVEPVCEKYQLTRMELDILLFLANNPCFDTATDIVEIRFLSKSQVSASIRLLEEKGCLRKEYADGNRKSAHLKLCEPAEEIIAEGHRAQEKFIRIATQGISEEELECMKRCNDRILKNIRQHMGGLENV